MVWNKKVIKDHEKTGRILTDIILKAFKYLKDNPNATESETKEFILSEFKKLKIIMDRPFATPIVAFGNHAAEPHYYPVPGKRKLKPGMTVLIDIWGRLKGSHKPYADITWMGYRARNGRNKKISKEALDVFKTIIASRDACVKFINKYGARAGKLANEEANRIIQERGYGKFIRHSTGHALGFSSPHGRYGRNLNRKNNHPLLKNVGYTIEPGIYMKNKLGARSEINFYIASSGKVVITTPPQKNPVVI